MKNMVDLINERVRVSEKVNELLELESKIVNGKVNAFLSFFIHT